MKRVLYYISILSIYSLITAFFYYTNLIYSKIYLKEFSNFRLLYEHLPYILSAISIFIGAHFNKTKIVFLNIIATLIYFFIYSHLVTSISLFIIINYLVIFFFMFKFTKESGIFTFNGIFKIIFSGSLLYSLYFIIINKSNFLINSLKKYDLPFNSLNYNLILLSSIPVILCIFLFNIKKGEESYFSKSFSMSIYTFFIAFSFIIYYNPVFSVRRFIYASSFNLSYIFIIISLYFSTWDKVFTDKLTGLLNRRALDEYLPKLGKTYSITMMDIDHFKNFNDKYGHQAGDDVLEHVAQTLSKYKFGKHFRYGGEEFSVITKGKDHNSIYNKVEDFRKTLAGKNFKLKRAKTESQIGKKVSVTVSIGIASASQFRIDPLDVIKAADGALYRAKKNGRNRIEVERRAKKRTGKK